MNEPIETTAVAIREDKPQELMRRATDVAGVCREIVLKTACQIQGKKYVKAEGWMSIATAHGCVAGSRDVKRVEGGWTAVGEIRRISDGALLAQAEGFVGKDEKRWGQADEYACRAMAQTRAISRACRAAFAHVVVLMDAGLSTTPAEEVPIDGFDQPKTSKAEFGGTRPMKQAKVTPEATQTPAKPVPVPTGAFKRRLLELLGPIQEKALEYCLKAGILLPTETLDDLPMTSVPATPEQKDEFMACVQVFVDGGEAKKPAYMFTESPAPTPKQASEPSENTVTGQVEQISEKTGTNKNGKPYTKVGIKVAGEWHNTFDTEFRDTAAAAKEAGETVTIKFKVGKFGREIESLNAPEQDDLPI